MKRKLLMASLLLCSFAVFATGSPKYDCSEMTTHAHSYEQVVTGYYVNGNQFVRIVLRVNGGYVTGFSTGRDFKGDYNWTFVPNASIRNTNPTFDGAIAREFSNTATLTVSGRSLKVYF